MYSVSVNDIRDGIVVGVGTSDGKYGSNDNDTIGGEGGGGTTRDHIDGISDGSYGGDATRDDEHVDITCDHKYGSSDGICSGNINGKRDDEGVGTTSYYRNVISDGKYGRCDNGGTRDSDCVGMSRNCSTDDMNDSKYVGGATGTKDCVGVYTIDDSAITDRKSNRSNDDGTIGGSDIGGINGSRGANCYYLDRNNINIVVVDRRSSEHKNDIYLALHDESIKTVLSKPNYELMFLHENMVNLANNITQCTTNTTSSNKSRHSNTPSNKNVNQSSKVTKSNTTFAQSLNGYDSSDDDEPKKPNNTNSPDNDAIILYESSDDSENERNSQSSSNEKYHLKKKRRNSIESKKQTRIVTPDKKEIIPYRVKM